MNAVSRILVVHENPLLRDCLTTALSSDVDFEAVAFEPDQDELSTVVSQTHPHAIIIDLAFSKMRAKDVIASVRQLNPEIAVVALVTQAVERDVVEAVTAGATVCVPENASLEELRIGVVHAISGKTYCSPQIASNVLARLGEVVRSIDWSGRVDDAVLTSRESEILRLIAEAKLSNKQIASRLCLSLYTVKNHVHNILEKLSVDDRHAAVAFARERAWI